MTFREKRRTLRLARDTMRELRDRINNLTFKEMRAFSTSIPREAYEACEFALSHRKTWEYDYDDHGAEIPGSLHPTRQHILFRRGSIRDEHFLFKDCPIFLAGSPSSQEPT